jgi:hypothetical protein
LAQAGYDGYNLHKISSKCGIFAEADANTLIKSGVPVEEIVASLFEAVVYQNLSTLTKGNTPTPGVLLLGGPNLFFRGLQEAWRHHLGKLWKERKIDCRSRPVQFRCRRRRCTTPASVASRLPPANLESASTPAGRSLRSGSRRDSGKPRRRMARRDW